PEQAAGKSKEIGPATDVYALGAILYECLTGRPPFRAATSLETILLVLGQEPLPPRQLQPGVPPDLETICLKCLQKRRVDRYTTAQLLAGDLRRYLDGQPVLARPTGPLGRLVKWARRAPYQAAAVAVGVAFVLALLTALFGLWHAAQTDAELQHQRADLNQRRLDEQNHQTQLKDDFTTLFSRAEKRATEATPGDVKVWEEVERAVRAALSKSENEPAFTAFPLLEPARRLLARAEGERAAEEVRAEHRARLQRLKDHHGDAVFFTVATSLEMPDSLDRTR